MDTTIAIIGYGFVGKAMKRFFTEAIVYDPFISELKTTKQQVNSCAVSLICVPTNMLPDGSCDTSIVESTLSWLKTPLVIIRSTVAPGTTAKLQKKYPKLSIVFQPEYIGETVGHPFKDEHNTPFAVFGGSPKACQAAIALYQKKHAPTTRYFTMTATEAEITKYFANTAVAVRVTLCNEFYNICQAFGADYNVVREAYIADPRVGGHNSFVYPDNRGFGGKCLPKDLNAIVKAANKVGYQPEFIADVLKSNDRIKGVGVKKKK